MNLSVTKHVSVVGLFFYFFFSGNSGDNGDSRPQAKVLGIPEGSDEVNIGENSLRISFMTKSNM